MKLSYGQRSKPSEKNFPDGNIHMYPMDVTSESSICKTANDIIDLGLRVDILINNAAINPTSNSLEVTQEQREEKFSLERWSMNLQWD